MDIVEYNGEGYMPLVSYDGWRVAIAAYSDNLLDVENDNTGNENTEYFYF